jgi:hypothetical protein
VSATTETHKNKIYLVTSMLAYLFRSWYVATCKIEVPVGILLFRRSSKTRLTICFQHTTEYYSSFVKRKASTKHKRSTTKQASFNGLHHGETGSQCKEKVFKLISTNGDTVLVTFCKLCM